MDSNTKEWVVYTAGSIAILMVGWGIFQILLSFAAIIPTVITGIFFLILQIVVLLLTVIILAALGFLILNIILNILSRFETRFTNQIASLRRLINTVTNNLASEVLAIITAVLISIAQDHFSSNDLTKYSIGVLSAVYLFFSIQLIKSTQRREKFIGVFFYVFPVLVAISYYAADISSLARIISRAEIQDLVMPVSAVITLSLAFYYSFKPQCTTTSNG